MRNLPAYKLKRELFRLGRQLRKLPGFFISLMFSTLYYDLLLARKRKVFAGNAAKKTRIAIYLFFPKNGLLQSHLRSIEYLKSSGYAPLLICNGTLSKAERETVLGLCWRYMERPNFGYDFGGYRDGVLSIKSELKTLDRLILMNDSTWFPVPGAMDWIAASEVLDVDYTGAIWSQAVKHEDPEQFEKIEWNVDKHRRNFHYASFALNIASPILSSAKFYSFWRRFPLSGEKNRTVRRGEIGLTNWVIKNGFSHGATTELAEFDQILSAKPDGEIRNLAENLIFVTDPEMRKAVEDFLAKVKMGEEFRRLSAEKLIVNAVSRQGASYSIIRELVENHDFAFLKKTPAFQKDGTEIIFRNALENTDLEFQNEVMREIESGR